MSTRWIGMALAIALALGGFAGEAAAQVSTVVRTGVVRDDPDDALGWYVAYGSRRGPAKRTYLRPPPTARMDFSVYDGEQVQVRGVLFPDAVPSGNNVTLQRYDAIEVRSIEIIRTGTLVERTINTVGGPPPGWVLAPDGGHGEAAYLDGMNFDAYDGLRIRVRGLYRPDAVRSGSTPLLRFDAIEVRFIEVIDLDGATLAARLRRDIRESDRDLYAGGREPTGLTHWRNGTYTCAQHGHRRTVRVILERPAPRVADGITMVAYYCGQGNHYWVHLTGGLMGSDVWTGPFQLGSRIRYADDGRGIIDALDEAPRQ